MIDYKKIAYAVKTSVTRLKNTDVTIRALDYSLSGSKTVRYRGPGTLKIDADQSPISYTLILSKLETDAKFTTRHRRRCIARHGRALKASNIPINLKTIFMCVVLHELGHVEQCVMLEKKGIPVENVGGNTHLSRAYALALFGSELYLKTDNHYGISPNYMYNSNELFADLFVFRNISRAWQAIKDIPDLEEGQWTPTNSN